MCVTPDECKSMLGSILLIVIIVTYYLVSYVIVCHYNNRTYRNGEGFNSTDGCNKWWVIALFVCLFVCY